jgi:NAD(P)-dependent dehydrogenase (short-subunit alcohol dehydrogenase family)
MVSKHAAVAYAEWLAIQYRGRGIGVSALCPLGVRTPLITRALAQQTAAVAGVLAGGELMEPEAVAQCAVEGLMAGTFLILPHEAVRARMLSKALDRDAWIISMQKQYGLDRS